MSDANSTPKKSDTNLDTKSESKSSETTSTSSSADSGGKSARDSVGGAAVGHYGYFSNIKSPEYKSGWDDIWGKKKKSGGKKKTAGKKTAPKPRAPFIVSLDFEDLPKGVRDGLADAARDQLKKKRISYDTRAKKGEVDWKLDCEVKR